MSRVNDVVIKIATVNGTGSASANGLLMKAIFRMGIPVVGKNYFPSNIQGLPTWYEIRVTGEGYQSRTDKIDLMIAMNAQTYKQDLAAVSPGGWLIYDSTWPRNRLLEREDINVLGVPLSRMCNEHFDTARARILMKNIAYVGVIAALLEIDLDVIKTLLSETFASKKHMIDSNLDAIRLGYDYAVEQFSCPLPVKVEAMDKTQESHNNRRQYGGRAWLRVCRRDRRRLVSNHAFDVPDGRLYDFLQNVSHGRRNRRQEILHHSGGRRACCHRHGSWRCMEWRARVYTHEWSRHFADERVHRICLLRRGADRNF